MIRHIINHEGMDYQIFLVIVGQTGYVINRNQSSKGHLCPCCLMPEHREAIRRAVNKVLWSEILPKVRWVSDDYIRYGESVGAYGFDQRIFCHGSLSEIPEEILLQLRNHETAI